MSEQQRAEQLKDVVAKAGAEWCGVQETVPPGLPLLMFNSKTSKSTYAISYNPDNFDPYQMESEIRKRIQEKDKQFEERKMNLKEKLHQIYSEIDHIDKSGHNKAQGYDYVKSVEVTRAIRKAFIEQKIYAEVNFDFVGAPYTIARAKEPSAPFTAVNVRCTVVFHDLETGLEITASGLGTGCDTNDKAAYKAQTGALKYALKNAFLVPDEADPEADESVDDPNAGRSTPDHDEMPDFQDAKRSAGTPSKPPKAETPTARPTPAPSGTQKPAEAATPAATPTPASPAMSSAPAAAAPSSTATAPAAAREPGDETATDTVQPPPPNAPEMLGSGLLPTEPQLIEYRKLFGKLGDDLSTEGKLKPSKGLPINRKLLVFLLNITGATDAKDITKGQWDNFFARVETAKAAEGVGLIGITKLVNKANGIEEKKK